MKALTIHQPYAELIARAEKLVENRTWSTSYRGLLAIHAGLSKQRLSSNSKEAELSFGAVVAVVDLVACIPLVSIDGNLDGVPSPHSWVREHAHTEGPILWIFGNVVRLREPVPMRGAQGLFDIPFQLSATGRLVST